MQHLDGALASRKNNFDLIRLVASHITPEHREAARAALKRAQGSGR